MSPGFSPATTSVAEREQKATVVLGHDILQVCGILNIWFGWIMALNLTSKFSYKPIVHCVSVVYSYVGDKTHTFKVNSVVWMFLTVKKASLTRSYMNVCCSFPLPKLWGLFEKTKAKKTHQPTKPYESAQYYFIIWEHGSRGALLFCIQHLFTAGIGVFCSDVLI